MRRVKVRHFKKIQGKRFLFQRTVTRIVGFLKNLNYIEGQRRKFILTGNKHIFTSSVSLIAFMSFEVHMIAAIAEKKKVKRSHRS